MSLHTHKTYQNGPDECELNSLEACALNIWPNVVSIENLETITSLAEFFIKFNFNIMSV
jgi:hypothetical protein